MPQASTQTPTHMHEEGEPLATLSWPRLQRQTQWLTHTRALHPRGKHPGQQAPRG